MIRQSLLSLVILAGAATGCTGADVVLSPTSYYGAYMPTVLNNAAHTGGMLVEVIGNPFDAPKADLERSITDAMTGSHFGPHVDFVTTILSAPSIRFMVETAKSDDSARRDWLHPISPLAVRICSAPAEIRDAQLRPSVCSPKQGLG